MKNLTRERVVEIFDKFKKQILLKIQKKEYEDAADLIEKAASWAVLFNFQYADNELDSYIKQISDAVIQDIPTGSITGRLVFVCSQLNDAGELVRQYARAIADNNIPARMIVINRIPNHDNSLKEIQSFKNIDLVMVSPHLGYVETAKLITTKIAEFKPSIILQHFVPNEVKALIAVSRFPLIPKYNINYTDHLFWLGSSILDYNIEFRPAGCNVSKYKRNIGLDRMFVLPYYPIIDQGKKFEGFPFNQEGKVVIFSGSVPYKVFGDGDMYFKTLDRILQENYNCVVMISINNRLMRKKVDKMCCKDRVYVVPWRRDFIEVMQNIDMLYNTYPVGGGLTTQTAIALGKPVLSLAKKGSIVSGSEVLFTNKEAHIDYYDINELCDYVHQLCVDEKLRKSEGERLSKLLITREEFAKGFKDIINGRVSEDAIKHYDSFIDYESMERFHLDYENESKKYVDFLFTLEGFSSFLKFPQFSWEFMKFIPIYFKRKVYKLIKN